MRLKKDFNGSDRETRATLKSNFQIIEDNFNNELNSYNNRISKLEQTSATHDEAKEAREFMNDKAERVVLGTDLSTVKRAVEMILKNEGVI